MLPSVNGSRDILCIGLDRFLPDDEIERLKNKGVITAAGGSERHCVHAAR